MNFNKFMYGLGLTLLGGLVMTGCKKPEPEDPADVVATFQYEISAENWAEVAFINYSQNASSYAWDFGDGNSATGANADDLAVHRIDLFRCKRRGFPSRKRLSRCDV